MAQIIINIYDTKKGVKVDVDAAIPVNEAEKGERYLAKVILQILENTISLYNKGLGSHVKATAIIKTISNTNGEIVNRLLEYEN